MLDIFGGGLLLLAFWFGFVLLFSLLSGQAAIAATASKDFWGIDMPYARKDVPNKLGHFVCARLLSR